MDKVSLVLLVILAVGLIYLFQYEPLITYSVVAEADGLGISTELFPLSKEVPMGGELTVATRIDTHLDENVDVTMSYVIRNDNKDIVFQKSKTLAVEKTAQITDNVRLLSSLGQGLYVLDVEVSYGNVKKTEQEEFRIMEEMDWGFIKDKKVILALTILAVFVLFLIRLWVQDRKIKEVLKIRRK